MLQQVTVEWFNDDLITLGRGLVECERNIKLIVILFVVHPDKSLFAPAKSIEYLGFVIDF